VLLLAVLVGLAIVAMTGAFGIREGAYRKRGIVVGALLLALAIALFLSNRVR
jgi:hypothetical protein